MLHLKSESKSYITLRPDKRNETFHVDLVQRHSNNGLLIPNLNPETWNLTVRRTRCYFTTGTNRLQPLSQGFKLMFTAYKGSNQQPPQLNGLGGRLIWHKPQHNLDICRSEYVGPSVAQLTRWAHDFLFPWAARRQWTAKASISLLTAKRQALTVDTILVLGSGSAPRKKQARNLAPRQALVVMGIVDDIHPDE
ncbi:hypothetical protein FRC05_010028 [Tulasnella sp. 425]|nr:hypothetical protein FRC05_010028 [Tulasnella sp. 425]